MKLDTKNTVDNVIFGDVEESNYSIIANGKMFKILSSKIYSDKILAPIRELICNAHDSHVAAGQKRPFDIHLPTYDEPYFYIRDYGVGLSNEEVKKLYNSYGATTKDDSNSVIGCMGLGSKSPFAYANDFEVIAYKDGVKNSYTCAMTSDIPKCVKFATKPTNEPNGLKIKFDVKTGDIHAFEHRMGMMYFFQDEINFVGKKIDFQKIPEYKEGSTASGSSGWAVEMGGVVYSVDMSFDRTPEINNIYRGWGSGYMFHAELGDVDITTSRESVELTKKTIRFLTKASKRIFDNIRKAFRTDYVKAETFKDKIELYFRYKRDYYFFKQKKLESIIEKIRDEIGKEAAVSCYSPGASKTKNVKNDMRYSIYNGNLFTIDSDKRIWVEYPADRVHHITAAMKNYADKEQVKVYLVNHERMSNLLKRVGERVVAPNFFDAYKPIKAPSTSTAKNNNSRESFNVSCIRKVVQYRVPCMISKQELETILNNSKISKYIWVTDSYKESHYNESISITLNGKQYDVNIKPIAELLASKGDNRVFKCPEKVYEELKKNANVFNLKEEVEKCFKSKAKIKKYKEGVLKGSIINNISKYLRHVDVFDKTFLKKYKGEGKSMLENIQYKMNREDVYKDLTNFELTIYSSMSSGYYLTEDDYDFTNKVEDDIKNYIDTTFPMLSLFIQLSPYSRVEGKDRDIITNYIKSMSK